MFHLGERKNPSPASLRNERIRPMQSSPRIRSASSTEAKAEGLPLLVTEVVVLHTLVMQIFSASGDSVTCCSLGDRLGESFRIASFLLNLRICFSMSEVYEGFLFSITLRGMRTRNRRHCTVQVMNFVGKRGLGRAKS